MMHKIDIHRSQLKTIKKAYSIDIIEYAFCLEIPRCCQH